MKDATTGDIFLNDEDWYSGQKDLAEGQLREVHFPSRMLKSTTIARMMVFQSKEKIEKMTME